MIPLDSAHLYEDSLRLLSEYVGQGFQGRLAQVFLGAKQAGGEMPVVGGGAPVGTGDVQRLLDQVYTKRGRLAAGQPSVMSLFNNEHLYPTGVMAGDLAGPSNIWRNNFQLQKAMVCYGSEEELANPAFIMESRRLCPHLRPPGGAPPGTLAQAECALNPGRRYRGEDRAKFMRRDPVSGGIAMVDLGNVQLWQNALVPQAGRIPAIPLVCALYHDAEIAAGRLAMEPQEFLLDFNLTPAEFAAYFDDDPAHPLHAGLVAAHPGLTWTRVAVAPVVADLQAPPAPIAAVAADGRRRRQRRRIALNDLPMLAPPVAPPAGGHWWAAEQAVQGVFAGTGWQVIDRSRQGVGFDFEAARDGQRVFIEVKSSTGACSPVLTAREHEAANEHGQRYVLAIVENYSPTEDVRILWVRDPARLGLAARQVWEFPVPRSRWLPEANVELVL